MKGALLALLLAAASAAQSQSGQSASIPEASAHVAPDPPATIMHDMSPQKMIEVMQMDDAARFGSVLVDQFEWRERNDALNWKALAWYGGDYDKLLVKSEGENDGDTRARNEGLWDHALASRWNLQTGVRHDSGGGPSRTWAAIGVAGLAPWWIEIDAALYVGDEGRTALRLESAYDLRLTQRLMLRPLIELNLYGKEDPQRRLGSGLSDIAAGLRLRYEVRREFAPYVGIQWTRLYGDTADFAEAADLASSQTQLVAGLRVWF